MSIVDCLPSHLLERCILREGELVENPKFVLHWMRTAIRLDECPTFDVARVISDQLDLPLIIYHGIDERYPYASYRHHRFLLEGAADVEIRSKKFAIKHLVHVSRENNRSPVLLDLAKDSAVVVTDMVDLEPWKEWTNSVTMITSVVEVDSHCVLPRPVFGKSRDRPFRFRDSTKKKMSKRLEFEWPKLSLKVGTLPEDWDPPFEPISPVKELQKDGGQSILEDCNIDPTVVPVVDMKGGHSEAMSRWEEWSKNNLRSYHRRRNNAADREGVSGLSPWLHYGMIASTKVVRDAKKIGGKGAEKFLDEMLVFREHAQHHVHDTTNADSWNNIPNWARESWSQRFPNFANLPKLQIERGNTRDRLWDAAQKGLIRHGIMHNNVRMTWGKAIAGYRADPEEAMALALELNNRFALDGRDANSIAGIQWCFGLFDRPFDPPGPTMGRIRKRPTSRHLDRIDIEKYEDWTTAHTNFKKLNVGIIGGGLSGRFAARLLMDLGHEVSIFDKGTRASGRLSNRQTEQGISFQMGARYLDSIPDWMTRYVKDWKKRGYVDIQKNRLTPARPFPELLEHIAEGVNVIQSVKIEKINQTQDIVELSGTKEGESFASIHDYVILAIPIEQAQILTKDTGLELSGESESCWVLWGPWGGEVDKTPEGWELNYGISDEGILEIRLNPEISKLHREKDKQEMIDYVTSSLGLDPTDWKSHRWTYSRPVEGPRKVINNAHISVIGDAFGKDIGTAGAALDSAARCISNLHLHRFTPQEFDAGTRQSDLSSWTK